MKPVWSTLLEKVGFLHVISAYFAQCWLRAQRTPTILQGSSMSVLCSASLGSWRKKVRMRAPHFRAFRFFCTFCTLRVHSFISNCKILFETLCTDAFWSLILGGLEVNAWLITLAASCYQEERCAFVRRIRPLFAGSHQRNTLPELPAELVYVSLTLLNFCRKLHGNAWLKFVNFQSHLVKKKSAMLHERWNWWTGFVDLADFN